jgi:NAD(P)-dependent dehydrogenase (short-subunit alcohol dehydrogenase family)
MGALEGKVAIIVGGTSGIGARTVQLFVAEGAQVVIAGRRRDEGEQLVRELGSAASFIATDVTSESDIKAMIDQTASRFGRIDCLMNNAGNPGKVSTIADLDMTHFDSIFAVHVRGTVLAIKHVAPVMLKQESGSIINTASLAGHLAGYSSFSYSAAKAAVIHLTKCVAAELGEKNIRVNSISPGPIVTGIFGKGAGLPSSVADRHTEKIKTAFEAALPAIQALRRIGMPEDCAQAALFLASDASCFVTGQDIAVDGGITAGRPSATMAAERAQLAKLMQS